METLQIIMTGIITLVVVFVVLPYLIGVAVAMFKKALDKFY
ncbi:MAG: hypothetical protein Q7S81_00175 [bacterium]|nr:hypothetical protein [bacterium]